MMRLIPLFLCLILLSSCMDAQTVPVLSLDGLEQRMENGKDTTYVINFWATWCSPCIKEMPIFEKLQTSAAERKVKVILVSIDSHSDLESGVIPFVQKRIEHSETFLLGDLNPSVWTSRVNENWNGSIPATLIVNTEKKVRHFHEGAFEEGQLETKLEGLGF